MGIKKIEMLFSDVVDCRWLGRMSDYCMSSMMMECRKGFQRIASWTFVRLAEELLQHRTGLLQMAVTALIIKAGPVGGGGGTKRHQDPSM